MGVVWQRVGEMTNKLTEATQHLNLERSTMTLVVAEQSRSRILESIIAGAHGSISDGKARNLQASIFDLQRQITCFVTTLPCHFSFTKLDF